MRKVAIWAMLYKCLATLQWIVAFLIAAISASLKADSSKLANTAWDFLKGPLELEQRTAWITIPVLTMFLGVAQISRSQIGAPWVWEHLHLLLDSFQESVFGNDEGELHHHRVTLFKRVRLGRKWAIWDWSGWLVPVERSGHATRKSKSKFRAPDDADRAEGVAGRTWAGNRMVYVEDLPDISENPSPAGFSQYAQAARIDVAWLRKHKPCSRSFCGIPFDVRGKRWGVIVLDSRNEHIKQKSDLIDTFFRLNGRYLSKLMERS